MYWIQSKYTGDSIKKEITENNTQHTLISLKVFCVVSTKCIDPWVLEFVVSNIKGNNQWENCISLDFYFRGLSGPRIQ